MSSWSPTAPKSPNCSRPHGNEAKELREGACHTETGDYLITTFPEERYKVTGLDSAAIYGGTCLVGPRWAISADPRVLEPLRAKVGGTVRRLRDSSATTAP
ncbi:hypothetical protein ACWDBO_14200 [Streptomyces mirabilis]|uniref:hypothetical protein n=1 Tax=Streptomyces mirabilis TaxID=68239 RepID=UPI00332AE633